MLPRDKQGVVDAQLKVSASYFILFYLLRPFDLNFITGLRNNQFAHC
jgi:hypothetical protein